MSSVVFDSTLDTSGLEAGIKRANRTIEQWVQGVEKEASGLDRTMQRIDAGIAAYFSVRELAGFARQVVETRGQFQQLNIAFETMLGNKEKADKLMQEAISFSQKTPFTLTDVASNIKQLMSMGIETNKVMDTMKSLGDVAAGVSVPISRLAINYGQVATLGTLQGRELRDFAMAGVPLVDELAKLLGKTKQEIQEMVTAGKIGFPLVEQAFKNMASEGGKFYNLMEKQNKSVTGQISNLVDRWQVMQNEIGKSNEGLIYNGISGLNYLITNYKEVIEVMKGLVVVLGAAKVASMYVAYEQKVQAAVGLLVAGSTDKQTLADARWIVMQERKAAAQRALNKSMLANPYVLAAAAIAALGYGIYRLVTYETDLEKALKKTNVEIENEKDRALELFAAVKVSKEGTEGYTAARKKLIDQYGDYIPAQDKELKNLDQIKRAQDAVNIAIADNIAVRTRAAALEDISAEYNPKIVDAQKDIIKQVEKSLGKERAAMVKQELAGLVAEYKAGLPGAEQALIDYRTKLMAEVGKINEEGLATSFKSANMANVFNPLIDALQSVKTETEAAEEAFKKYKSELEIDQPLTPGKVVAGITADQQRLQLRKQLVEEEKKLKELEKTPGTDPLKAIEDQKKVIADIKERLGLKDEVITKDDEIKKKEEELDKAIAAGNDAEIKAIAKKIVELNRELDLRKKLAAAALAAAQWDGTVPEKLQTSQINIPQIFPKGQQPKTKTAQQVANEMTTLSTANERRAERERKKLEKNNEKEKKSLEEQIELRQQIVNSVANLITQLGAAQGMDQETMGVLNAELDAISQMMQGDFVGAATSALMGIMSIIPSRTEKFEKQIEHINALLDEQARLIDRAQRTGGEGEAMRQNIIYLEKQRAIYEKAIGPEALKMFQKLGPASAETVANIFVGLTKEMMNQYVDVLNAIEDAQTEYQDFLNGAITQNTLTDAIAQGFQDGKTSVQDFADYMNDVLTNAVLNIFKSQFLLPKVNEMLMPVVEAALDDNELTQQEIDLINAEAKRVSDLVEGPWKKLTQGLDFGSEKLNEQTGLSGAIQRSITEETSTELAGLMRKISDDNRMNRDYNKLSVDHLMNIDRNTFNTVEQLTIAVSELKTISSNTKPSYSGLGGG